MAAMLLVTVSCAGTSNDGLATRNDTAPVREDLAPLTKRFMALGEPISARWKSGTMGDPRVPGPSTYWIDAILQLTPAVADQLAAGTSGAAAPEVVEDLVSDLPAGPWVGSEPAWDPRRLLTLETRMEHDVIRQAARPAELPAGAA